MIVSNVNLKVAGRPRIRKLAQQFEWKSPLEPENWPKVCGQPCEVHHMAESDARSWQVLEELSDRLTQIARAAGAAYNDVPSAPKAEQDHDPEPEIECDKTPRPAAIV